MAKVRKAISKRFYSNTFVEHQEEMGPHKPGTLYSPMKLKVNKIDMKRTKQGIPETFELL